VTEGSGMKDAVFTSSPIPLNPPPRNPRTANAHPLLWKPRGLVQKSPRQSFLPISHAVPRRATRRSTTGLLAVSVWEKAQMSRIETEPSGFQEMFRARHCCNLLCSATVSQRCAIS